MMKFTVSDTSEIVFILLIFLSLSSKASKLCACACVLELLFVFSEFIGSLIKRDERMRVCNVLKKANVMHWQQFNHVVFFFYIYEIRSTCKRGDSEWMREWGRPFFLSLFRRVFLFRCMTNKRQAKGRLEKMKRKKKSQNWE